MSTNKRSGEMFVVANVISLLFLCYHYSTAPKEVSTEHLTISCLVVVFVCSMFLAWRSQMRCFSNWIGLDTLFLPGFVICQFSIPALLSINAIALGAIRWNVGCARWFNAATACSAIALTFFCLSFQAGMHLFHRKISSATPGITGSKNVEFLKPLGNRMSLLGFSLFAVFVTKTRDKFFGGDYQGLIGMSELDQNLFTIAQMLLLTGAVASVAYCQLTQARGISAAKIPLFFLTLFLLALLLHGDRGGVVQCLIPVGGALLFKKRIPLVALVISAMVLLPLLQVVRAARSASERGGDVLVSEAAKFDFYRNTLDSLVNFGASGMLTPVSMNYVDQHGSLHGMYTVNGLASAVPFSRRLLTKHVFDVSGVESDSSILLTWIVNRNFKSGVGVTTVAEAFLDFGIIGVVYTHIFIGFVGAYLQVLCLKRPDNSTVLVGYLLAMGIFVILPRYGAFSGIVRGLLFPMLAFWIAKYMLSCRVAK